MVARVVQKHLTEVVGVPGQGRGADVVEHIAVVRDPVGDAHIVHMSGEHHGQSGIGESLCPFLPVVHEKRLKNGILQLKVLYDAVVLHADGRLSVTDGILNLLQRPRHQLIRDVAVRLLHILTVSGGICGIFVCVQCNQTVAAVQLHGVGHTSRLPLGGAVGVVRQIVAEVLVNVQKVLRGRDAGRLFFAVFKGDAPVVVDVVVAVDDDHGHSRILFKLLQPLRQLHVVVVLAVGRQVAGEENVLHPVFLGVFRQRRQRRIQQCRRFVALFGVGFGIAHERIAPVAGALFGKIVDVGNDTHLQGCLLRGGKCHTDTRQQQHRRQKQRHNGSYCFLHDDLRIFR